MTTSSDTPKIRVGDRWPGEIEVVGEAPKAVSPQEPRVSVTLGLILLFGVLLVAFTAYGMANGDADILDRVFELVRYGLFAALGWAFGRQHSRGGMRYEAD